MKVPFKKPKGYGVADMDLILHRRYIPKPGKDDHPVQLRYPNGHPMRIYKDKKRAMKNGRL